MTSFSTSSLCILSHLTLDLLPHINVHPRFMHLTSDTTPPALSILVPSRPITVEEWKIERIFHQRFVAAIPNTSFSDE